jgi:hypothetical protein
MTLVQDIILQSSSYESGKLVGKALFFLALAGLGVYVLLRMRKKK